MFTVGIDQVGGQTGYGAHVPSSTHQKVHQHMEQFSRKTNWKLAGELLYHQGNKTDTQGRKEKWFELGPVSVEGTQRKKIIRWTPPHGREQWEPNAGHPSLGILCRRDKPV